MSYILVNDIFNELLDENKRLFNELIFADKCLKLFFDFKTFIDLISINFKSKLISDDLIKYNNLCKNIDKVFMEKDLIFVKPKPIDINNKILDSNSVNLPEVCNNISISEPPKNANHNKKNETKLKTYSRPQPKSSSQIHWTIEPMKNANDNNNNNNNNETKVKTSSLRPKNSSLMPSKPLTKCSEMKMKTEPNLLTNMSTNVKIMLLKKAINRDSPQSESNAIRLTAKPIASKLDDKSVKTSCDVTKRSTNQNNVEVYKHLRYNTTNTDIPFQCLTCGRGFRTQYLFYSHYKRIHDHFKQPLVCTVDDCNRTFKTMTAFRSHQTLYHLTAKNIVCDQIGCRYRCSTLDQLNRHKNSYSMVCSVCGYHCKTKANLDNHMDSHSTERNHCCPHDDCGKAFRTKHLLQYHISNSHSEKKYNCDWPGCEYTCRQRSRLKLHSKAHVPDSMPCDWPGCTFIGKRYKALIRHKHDVHFGQRKYVCDWPQCDKSYKRKEHLKNHLKSHSKNL